MANYKLNSKVCYGKYKGLSVKEIIQQSEGRNYLTWIHNSKLNVKLTQEVFIKIKELQDENRY